MSILRRLRGVAGTAVFWGISFTTAGLAWMGAVWLLGGMPPRGFTFRMFVMGSTMNFVAGAVAGSMFATILMLRARNRTVNTLTDRSMAKWGFLGAAILPIAAAVALPGSFHLPSITWKLSAAMILFGTVGAVTALTTVRIARRAPDTELLPESVVAAIGRGR